MRGSLNKVMLIGNLGKDPEVRHLETGASVANFSIATTETYKNRNGEKVSQTEWHNIVLWRGLADISEKYLKKGDKVYIEGKIRTRSWQDKEGNTRYSTEIIGDNMVMLGKTSENSGSQFVNPTKSTSDSSVKTEEKAPETPKTTSEEIDKTSLSDGELSTSNDDDDLPF